ncbi:MAG: lysophospholipid acyltransferase family protein [Cyclobacteriaceae bacterium]
MFYFLFQHFLRISLRMYFKKVEIVGLENLPKDAPIIIAPNHQNAFLDPFLAGSFMPFPINFLTRADVFTWWSKPILKSLNMIPIYRIRDGYGKLSMNDAIFRTCEELFRQKKTVLIFAEGNHGKDHYLRPLTKGTSRLALQAQAAIEDDLQIVPVGINYFDHRKPGAKVILVYGKPFSVKPFVEKYDESSGSGLIAIRDALSEAMKSTLVIPEKTDDYEQLKKTIFQKKHEKLSFSELRKIKGGDTEIKARSTSSHWLPKVLNPVPFLIIVKMLTGVKDVVFKSSVKYAVGVFAFPIWWLLSFFIIYWLVGIISASITVLTMILSLIASYKWLR